MTIDWTHFTPFSALVGGVMIGAAASVLILGAGRIMGAAGIVAGALDARDPDAGWRWALIAGLLLSPALATLIWKAEAPEITSSWPLLVVAGLVVGFGARLGSGCTSGHGVCGIARLSPRSLFATGLFMASGVAATFVVRHLLS
jgi:uncharacterized membrane protein YedE/YeeE